MMRFSDLRAKISISSSSFASIIASNQIYVDKTSYIYDLCVDNNFKFLSRPRRFGKSTIVATLEELFSHGVKPYDGHDSYFKGLYIEDKWSDDNEYLIMKLDFAQLFVNFCKTGNDFERKFVNVLNEYVQKFNLPPHSYEKSSEIFNYILESIPESSLVILIDEYDFPLTYNINHPDVFDEIAEVLRGFYQQIKSNSDKYRFVFITGITRYKDTSIFTAGNTIEDVSLYT